MGIYYEMFKGSPRGCCYCLEWCSGSEAPGGDPVVLERSHVFCHPLFLLAFKFLFLVPHQYFFLMCGYVIDH